MWNNKPFEFVNNCFKKWFVSFQWKKIPFSKINNYDIKLDSNIDEFDMLSETEKKILDLMIIWLNILLKILIIAIVWFS